MSSRSNQRSMVSIMRNRRAKHVERETLIRERDEKKALAERTNKKQTVNESMILRRSLFKKD
jgi:hypothetical protein